MAFNLFECRLAQAQPPDPQLVPVGAPWKFLIPAAEPTNGDWRTLGYEDTAWLSGPSGFSLNNTEATRIPGTAVTSVLFRTQFEAVDPTAIQWLLLRVDYSDGFVAYLNGTEIARRGVTGAPPSFDALATAHSRGPTEEIDVSAKRGALLAGTNVLAIELHGAQLPATNLTLVPELCANFQRGPCVQQVTENRAQILWRTPVPATSVVDYGLTPSLGLSVTNPALTTSHEVELGNLLASTNYHYRVRSTTETGEAVSPAYSFRTAATSGDITFAVLGDSGSGWVPQHRIATAMADVAPDLVLHAGDTAYGTLTPYTADIRCLSVYAPLMHTTPFYVTMGNHDLYSGATTFLETFSLPTNNVTGSSLFYSFDRGDVHFVSLLVPSLQSFSAISPYALGPGSPQLEWLTNDLSTTTKPWRVLLLHSPLFTSSGHRLDDKNANGIADRLELQSWILPVAAEHGVQLVFSGHDHCYERFAPTNGIHCYVTGGGGSSLYGLTELDALSRHFEKRYHFLKVVISGEAATVEALDQFGTVFDSAVIHRISPLQIRITALPPRGIRLEWDSEPGSDYAIEMSLQPDGMFEPVNSAGLPVKASGYLTTFDLNVAAIDSTGAPLFFRIKKVP